jgi:hypothetical protein
MSLQEINAFLQNYEGSILVLLGAREVLAHLLNSKEL